MPTVGAIVPVHGEPRYLGEALDGLLGQDPLPDEVIVVDDASPRPIRLPPGHRDACRLMRREQRGGPAAARNDALTQLSADLVALCDADDWWRPGKLRAQLDALGAHPRAELCFGSAEIIGPGGERTDERWEELPPGPLAGLDLVPLLYERNPIPTSSVLVSRAALGRVGGFGNLPQAEDQDTWLRLAAAGIEFLNEPSAVVRYRRHPGGLTADVANLATASLELHRRHAKLVGEAAALRAEAADRRALADGLARRRDWAGARRELAHSGALEPLEKRDRRRRAAMAIPGLRRLIGRGDPYRGRT